MLTPYRAGVTTEGLKHNKYRSRCFGRGACARRDGRMRHPRGVRLADRPHLPGDGYRQPDAAHERDRARDPRRPATGKARGVAFVDTENGRSYEARGRVVVVAASTLESARLLLLSKSSTHPNGIGNSSGHVGHNFCEHVMGPSVTGLVKDRIGQPRTQSTTGGPAGSTCRASATWRRSTRISFAATASRVARGTTMFPGNARETPGFGAAYKKHVRDYAGAFISMGGFGEVLPRYENRVELDPAVKDRWGIPVLRFNYRFGDNEKKMCQDMAETAQEMFERGGIRDRRRRSRRS